MSTLKEAKCGQTVKVVKIHGEGAVKRRIMDMGITKNTEIYIRKVAPKGKCSWYLWYFVWIWRSRRRRSGNLGFSCRCNDTGGGLLIPGI